MGKLVRNGIEYSGSGGGGGGSSVEITPSLVSGTKIADYEIDGTEGSLYAPTPQVIEANPAGTASTDLNKLQVENTIYSIPDGIANLTDVNLSNLTDRQILQYNITSQKWENANNSGGSAIILNGQIYSTEERQIGVWLDGKPLYQKTWDFGSQITIPSNTWTDTSIRLADWDIENIVLTFSTDNSRSGTVFIGASASEGNTYLQLLNARDSALGVRYLTVQYTKTTDTSGSGGYQAYGFSPIIYSTTERQIGVWTDNKPLYQKTIDTGLIPNNSIKTIAHNINNIETIVNYFGIALNSSGSDAREMPYVGFSDWSISLYVDATDINIQTKQNLTDDFPRSYVTIQYTKTTDIPGSGSYNTLGVPTHHYSTDEQVVGTWVDGNTLYEKTITVSNITVSANNYTTIQLSNYITGLSHALMLKTLASVNGEIYELPSVHPGTLAQYSWGAALNNNEVYISRGNASSITSDYIFVIQYTK